MIVSKASHLTFSQAVRESSKTGYALLVIDSHRYAKPRLVGFALSGAVVRLDVLDARQTVPEGRFLGVIKRGNARNGADVR